MVASVFMGSKADECEPDHNPSSPTSEFIGLTALQEVRKSELEDMVGDLVKDACSEWARLQEC